MMRRLKLMVWLLVIGLAFAAGWWTHTGIQPAKIDRERQLAVEAGGGRVPLWADVHDCREPTAAEQAQNRSALQVLEVFGGDRWNSMQMAAVKHFAYPWSQRRAIPPDDKDKTVPCLSEELRAAVTVAAIKAHVFEGPFLYGSQIALAEQLGPRDPQIIDAVGRSAFKDGDIPDDPPFRNDLRPYARLVLAEFGQSASAKWAKEAFAQMSANNQMGTGAAQIAVAGGEPQALPAVQGLMDQILAGTPKHEPIPRSSRDRLYELAFALGMAGEAAQPYAGPLVELLDRKVESWAPPFGMVHLSSARMCPLARRIGGAVAAAAQAKDFCAKKPKAFEQ